MSLKKQGISGGIKTLGPATYYLMPTGSGKPIFFSE
ncbi:hypothetical protein N824_21365 [Pedobacter sp. V48]|nr:hypothetical protein N824_21365 [Pedobacter sp. V48]